MIQDCIGGSPSDGCPAKKARLRAGESGDVGGTVGLGQRTAAHVTLWGPYAPRRLVAREPEEAVVAGEVEAESSAPAGTEAAASHGAFRRGVSVTLWQLASASGIA